MSNKIIKDVSSVINGRISIRDLESDVLMTLSKRDIVQELILVETNDYFELFINYYRYYPNNDTFESIDCDDTITKEEFVHLKNDDDLRELLYLRMCEVEQEMTGGK